MAVPEYGEVYPAPPPRGVAAAPLTLLAPRDEAVVISDKPQVLAAKARKLQAIALTDVILGEAMYADERQLPADATTAELLRSGGAWKTGDLTELRAFLASVELHAHIGVELDAEAELRIQRTIEEHLADNRGELRRVADSGRMNDARLRRESTIIEPPFVIGLRELLAIIIEGDGGGAKIRTPD